MKGSLLTTESSPARSDEVLISDEQIINQLKARSEDGVRLLLDVHGSRAKSLLLGKFGEKHEGAIDESISDAALTIWFKANEFDPNRGSLGGWFFTCARNALRTTLRAEQIRPLLQNLELEELLNVPAEADVRRSKGLRRLLGQLQAAISRLSDMQQDIILTDLAESGVVDNAALASKWETSTNSIHVSRNKAHKRLARMLGRGRKR